MVLYGNSVVSGLWLMLIISLSTQLLNSVVSGLWLMLINSPSTQLLNSVVSGLFCTAKHISTQPKICLWLSCTCNYFSCREYIYRTHSLYYTERHC